MQRSIGNRAVVDLLAARPAAATAPSVVSIQRKAGDISRSDYAILVKVEQFLNATERNMSALYPAVKEDLKDPALFTSTDMRRLAISFNTNKVEKFVESRASGKGVYKTAKASVTELLAEFVNDRKTEALTHEAATGGHSVDRHGPEVTDIALQARLTTGVAPDNVLSVAPGYSSKFVSYMAWLDARQAAIDALSAAVNATQLRLIALAPKLPAAKATQDQRALDVANSTGIRAAKKIAHQRAFGQQGEGSVAETTAKGELDTADANLLQANRAQAGGAASVTQLLDRFELPIDRALVDLGDITSFKVKAAYRVIIDNGRTIGSGWKGLGAKAAAPVTHGGRTVDDAVLYGSTEATEALTKSLTTLDGGVGGTPLMTAGAGVAPPTPNAALRVADWNVVQHFPAPPDAIAGIE